MTTIHLSPSGKTIAVPYDARLALSLPCVRRTVNGGEYLLMPYTPAVHSLLSTLKIKVPTPFSRQYTWPAHITPFEAQRATADLFTQQERAYCLNDMGTGKTVATLAAADWLMDRGDVSRALIVSPLSTLSLVWGREVFFTCPHHPIAILHGTRKQRFNRLADESCRFYIINHDAVHILSDEIEKRRDIDLVIIDEVAEFRTPFTRKWKVLKRLEAFKPRIWGLTGAPRPRAPTDVWAQTKLITPGTTPSSFKAFQDMTMRQIWEHKWDERPEGNRIAFEALQPSVRFTRDECVDLPPTTYSFREVPLSATARKAYKEMKAKYQTEANAGVITAANAGVKLNKLLQISCGWVYDNDQNVIGMDAKDRLKTLLEVLRETSTKVLVFVPFVFALHAVTDHVRKAGYSAELVYGETSRARRNEIFNAFKDAADPHVLVCHPQTMAHGLNFQHAATAIWFAPMHSYALVDQANARITRPGQQNHTHIIQFVGSDAERRVYDTLEERASAQELLLGLFK